MARQLALAMASPLLAPAELPPAEAAAYRDGFTVAEQRVRIAHRMLVAGFADQARTLLEALLDQMTEAKAQ